MEERSQSKEQLDNLSLSGSILHKTLSSLNFINSLFGTHRQLSNAVLRYCMSKKQKEHFKIVDLGCGGGDCIRQIAKTLEKNNFKATFIGIDGNAQSIAFAKTHHTYTENTIFTTADILHPDFEVPECDLLISSHFIYHFKDDHLIEFLKRLKSKKTDTVIFSELRRSKWAFFLFKATNFLMPITRMAKEDGLKAIQRTFTIKELQRIIKNSEPTSFSVIKKPWFRMLATFKF